MRVLRVVLMISAAFYAAFIARSLFEVKGALYATLFDDAMISMRYARNLAGGQGLVWNPGGPPVQGFTNPAWTLIMAGVHAAGAPPRLASLVVMIIGAALLLTLATETFRLGRLITEDDDIAVTGAAFIATSYAVVFWTLRGMEVGLLALLITVAARAAIAYARDGRRRDLLRAGAALIAALWTRPDALVPAAVLSGYLASYAPRGRRQVLAIACVVGALGVAAPLVCSRWYYGTALPNTYYLKLGGSALRDRVGRGLLALLSVSARSLAPALLPAAALPVVAGPATPRVLRELALLAALVAAQLLYSISVGGDAWEWMGYANRYIAIVMPFLAILTGAGVQAVVRRRGTAWPSGAGFLALIGVHVVAVLYLLRSNRGIDSAAVDAYRAHSGAVVALLLASGAVLALLALAATARRSFAGVCAVVWLLTNGVPSGRWALENASMVSVDQNAARVGLVIHETLAPGATVAVSKAGSIPYFAERTTVDLLGKNDPAIARMAPVIAEFVPGHNKWDLRYSIGQLRPDLACNLPRRPGEIEYLRAEGYHAIGAACFVRAGARLDESRLAAGLAAVYPAAPSAAERR